MKLSLFIRYFPRYVPKPKTAAPGGRWLKSLWDWQVSWDSEQLRASEVTPPVSGRALVMAGHRGWEEWVARKHMLGGTLGVTGRGEHLGGVSTQGLWLQITSLDTSFLLKKDTQELPKLSRVEWLGHTKNRPLAAWPSNHKQPPLTFCASPSLVSTSIYWAPTTCQA